MSKILSILTPTNWGELSGEERDEFMARYRTEYFRLYEERIGAFPGTRGRASRLWKDDQADAESRHTMPDVFSKRDPQK
jgi:hypothetical protein